MNGRNEVRIPDVEVIISAAGSDVGVVAFYLPANVHEEAEIVASIREAGARAHLVALLHQAIAVINGEDWYTLAELDTRADEAKATDPPF